MKTGYAGGQCRWQSERRYVARIFAVFRYCNRLITLRTTTGMRMPGKEPGRSVAERDFDQASTHLTCALMWPNSRLHRPAPRLELPVHSRSKAAWMAAVSATSWGGSRYPIRSPRAVFGIVTMLSQFTTQ